MRVRVLKPFLFNNVLLKVGSVIEIDKANLAHYKEFGMVVELEKKEDLVNSEAPEAPKRGRKRQ